MFLKRYSIRYRDRAHPQLRWLFSKFSENSITIRRMRLWSETLSVKSNQGLIAWETRRCYFISLSCGNFLAWSAGTFWSFNPSTPVTQGGAKRAYGKKSLKPYQRRGPRLCALINRALAPKKDEAQAIGRSAGRLSTKIYATCDALEPSRERGYSCYPMIKSFIRTVVWLRISLKNSSNTGLLPHAMTRRPNTS